MFKGRTHCSDHIGSKCQIHRLCMRAGGVSRGGLDTASEAVDFTQVEKPPRNSNRWNSGNNGSQQIPSVIQKIQDERFDQIHKVLEPLCNMSFLKSHFLADYGLVFVAIRTISNIFSDASALIRQIYSASEMNSCDWSRTDKTRYLSYDWWMDRLSGSYLTYRPAAAKLPLVLPFLRILRFAVCRMSLPR